jgi:hypothetical protein
VPAKTKHSTNVKVIAGIFVSKSNSRKLLLRAVKNQETSELNEAGI